MSLTRHRLLWVAIQVHDVPELTRVLKLGSLLDKNIFLGINNRDLTTFEVTLENTKTIMESDAGKEVLDRGILMTGESGIFTYDDVAYLQQVTAAGVSRNVCGIVFLSLPFVLLLPGASGCALIESD